MLFLSKGFQYAYDIEFFVPDTNNALPSYSLYNYTDSGLLCWKRSPPFSVSDPDSFFPDQDPFNNPDVDRDPETKNMKKFTAKKKI